MATNAIRSLVDPRTSPYFGRGVGPEGDYYGVGGGDGIGYLESLMTLPGSEAFIIPSSNPNESGARIDPDALYAYLQANGLSLNDEAMKGGGTRYLTDASGALVGAPTDYLHNDNAYFNMALGMLGGAAYGMLGGAGVGAGAGGAAGGASGSAGGAGSIAAADAVYAGTGGFGGAGGTAGAAAGGAGATGAAIGGGGAASTGGAAMSWADIWPTLLSTGVQSITAGNAAEDQRAATGAAMEEQRRQFDLTRADTAPYREAGVGALGTLQQELGRMPTPEEVMAQPGYQFGLQQGQLALDRKQSAMGGRVSGAALKRAAEFATNYAANGYNAEYQRRQDRLARLQTLAGLGQSATSNTNASNQGSTNAITALLSGQGDASAAAGLAQGNIWGNGINQIGAMYNRRQQPGGGGAYINPDYNWGP